MSAVSYTTMESPIGPLMLAGDQGGLRLVHFLTGRRPKSPQGDWIEDSRPFKEVIRQLEGYFEGKLSRLRFASGPGRHGVSTSCLAQPAQDSLRRNHQLRTTGSAHR